MRTLFDKYWVRILISVMVIAVLVIAYNWDVRRYKQVMTTTATAEDPSIQEMEIKAQEDYRNAMNDAKDVVTRLDAAIVILQSLLDRIESNIGVLESVQEITPTTTTEGGS